MALDVSADVAAGEAGAEAGPGPSTTDAADNFSDLDDAELDQYLATPEEAEVKKQIWNACNKCACWLLRQQNLAGEPMHASEERKDAKISHTGGPHGCPCTICFCLFFLCVCGLACQVLLSPNFLALCWCAVR